MPFGRGFAFDFDPYDFGDPFGYGGMDGPHYGRMAAVSDRAMAQRDQAEQLFLQHLATVDTSAGPVTTEIIQSHLVPDMRKAFAKFVKGHGCTATSRQISRQEQDTINQYKSRKSLVYFTSVKVTPEAQKAYLEKNPGKAAELKKKSEATASARASGTKTALGKRNSNAADVPVAEGSGSVSKKQKPAAK